MKEDKGALYVLLSLSAYLSGFILVVWPCLSLSYYSELLLSEGHTYHSSTRENIVPIHTHLYAYMLC